MTNSEIYDNFSKEIQDKIETNCNNLNKHSKFDVWIRVLNDDPQAIDSGIRGAFVWINSPEGHEYWSGLNKQIEKL